MNESAKKYKLTTADLDGVDAISVEVRTDVKNILFILHPKALNSQAHQRLRDTASEVLKRHFDTIVILDDGMRPAVLELIEDEPEAGPGDCSGDHCHRCEHGIALKGNKYACAHKDAGFEAKRDDA